MKIKKELPAWGIITLPFLYLAWVWNDLPGKVPMHWNINGEIDRYGSKAELLLIPIFLPLFMYLLFLIVPVIDPKNKIGKMGNKYEHLKTLVTTLMSLLAIFIIHSAKNQSFAAPGSLFLILGVLYLILGNYLKTIKPNYFIGIRTPWTLENETVWRETHNLGGKMWFAGGIVIVMASLILNRQQNLVLFLIVTGIITVIPVVYSYIRFREPGKTA